MLAAWTISLSLLGQTAAGPHPQIVQHWQASYRFDCGERTVSVDLAVAAGRATVSAIDLGRDR